MTNKKDWREGLKKAGWKMLVISETEDLEIWGKGTTRDIFNSDGCRLSRFTNNKIQRYYLDTERHSHK